MSELKEVTIYDLARKLNISATTVSRGLQNHPAISEKTKKKIFELVEELGYRSNHFARNLRQQQTKTLGVIVPRLNSVFMASVIAGMESVANTEGYNLIISQSSESSRKEEASVRTLFHNRVDGLLVSLACDTTNLSHFDAFHKKNIPVIFFDRTMENNYYTSVLIDNRKAAYETTRHLLEQGCRNLVHITALQHLNVYKERLAGFKEALADFDLPFKNENVMIGNLSMEAGRTAAEEILQMPVLPDGVFVANDDGAVGCMLTLKQHGIRIPEDIAFAGFNNDAVAQVIEPNLTTIHYPGYKMGETATRHLINHLAGVSPIDQTNTIILRSELIIRASSLKKIKDPNT